MEKTYRTLAIVAILVIATFGFIALFQMYYPPAAVVAPAVKYEGYFRNVGLDIDDLDNPWNIQDFDEINPVVFEDEDQVTAGNATLELENGTSVDDKYTLYLYIRTEKTSRGLKLEFDQDDTGQFSEDTVAIAEASLLDYDTQDEVYSISIPELLKGDYKTGVLSEGEYILKLVFRIKGATVSATEGTLDEIGKLSGELDSPDADSDDPTEFEDFLITVKSV